MVAHKALEMSLADSTLENVRDKAAYLRRGLEQLKPRFPFFTAIRQQGLVMGLQFADASTSWMMMRALYENGIWAIVAAFDESVIQFKPGLLIDNAYCDEVLQRFEQACIWLVNNANALIMAAVARDSAPLRAAQSIARTALPQWGLSAAGLTLVKHRENAVFKVSTDGGEHFAMRIHRQGYHSAAELQSEMLWMQALAADGIATPAIIATSSGARFAAVVVEDGAATVNVSLLAWVDGNAFDHLGRVERGVVPELQQRYRQLGALAARLHNQSERWQRPAGFVRHAWDSEGLLGESPLWGKFWLHPLLSAQQRTTLLEARMVLRGLLRQLGQGEDCYGLIHADFLPENILVDHDELYLIDFDDCGFGWYLFEMATSLFPKINEPYFDSLVENYVQGYRSERPFSDAHLEIFPAFLLLRGMTWLGWLMTRSEALVNSDRIAQEIINGLCQHIPELLAQVSPLERLAVRLGARWQGRQLHRQT
jgi:Ser/Thr protein kinase RdoA (MazF antagonist)